MRDVAAVLIALVAYAAAGARLRAVRRQRGARAPLALFATLLALAVGWTFLAEPVARAVEHVTGVDLLGHLLADSAALCTGCGTQAMLVYLTHDERAGSKLMRPRLIALVVAVTAMGTAFVVASPARLSGDLPADYGSSDFYLAYSLPYLAYLAYIFIGITRLCWRSVREAGRVPFLAAGLRLIAAGGSAGLLYVALRAGYIALARSTGSNRYGQAYDTVSEVLVATVTVLVIAGATLPSWAPRLAVYRDVRQLSPLWRALIRRYPDLSVDPRPSRAGELLPVGDVPRRRNRHVIEILDARLELRRRLRPGVARLARDRADQQGLQGQDLEATVEASRIAVALHELPDSAVQELHHETPAPTGAGGTDLESESAWLRKVSQAFAHSPVVADVVEQSGAAEQPRGDNLDRVARLVTELTAPAPVLVALLLGVGAASGRTVLSGLGWGLLAAVFFSIAPFAGIVWGVVRGRLSDHHVSQRTQRPLVIVLSLASFVTGFSVMTARGAPGQLVAVMAALLAAAVVCLLITLAWKISMHMAVAGCAAALLPAVVGPAALLVWPALLGIGWSRVRLRDHTPAQTVAGALVGAAVAGAAFAVLH